MVKSIYIKGEEERLQKEQASKEADESEDLSKFFEVAVGVWAW